MNGTDPTSDWIRRFHRSASATSRLVCFPHAGGSASYFHGVSKSLTPDTEVLAVQYPGRQDRRGEPLLDSVGAMADAAYEALAPWTDRPLGLFGHSMGALVAFEVAARLAGDGVVPVGLFASGRRAPSCYRDENVHLRDDAGVMAELNRLDGTDSRLLDDAELREMILPALRSDYRAVETYHYTPRPTLVCPVWALVGDDDPRTTLDEARAWSEHTTGLFELTVFPGGHFYLNAQADAVVDLVRSRLSAHRTP
ncbi:thioesterase II family protein [Wenjunlia tyrosinilytica]|jgi:surfactin synthase thioesterase subunit|uniref:Thioesterase n=1 Tax=Wenjunlia tyrosinilytica TaxID=1544741 RepID=A0A917ZY87_9ACTN|nr:alpha/beta fold hydrolase [Wenjunlia tyrosinilytica]GGO99503.1 thioesterase [Wenjunlia tyrosinilytica]